METNTKLRLHLEERGVPTLFARGMRLGPKWENTFGADSAAYSLYGTATEPSVAANQDNS